MRQDGLARVGVALAESGKLREIRGFTFIWGCAILLASVKLK